jgi:N,N'-diacetyllegionaminate synthase
VWEGLAAYASELGIRLQLDIFGATSLRLAERLGVGAVKLHGTDINNLALLAAVAGSTVPRVLLGAGGSHAGELEEALRVLAGKAVVVLLGFQGYPTPDDTNQIARVRLLAERFGPAGRNVTVGFADHAAPEGPLRYALAASAVGAGAAVIEKHLTLGRGMKLEDHESALNPDEFAEFVSMVRGCAAAMGTAADGDDFGMSEVEKGYRVKIRRHVVAARDLPKGATLTPADVVLKRTSAQQAMTDVRQVYARTLNRDLQKDAAILDGDLD